MQFINEFENVDISKLRTYLNNSNQNFEDSQLYSASRDEKFIDRSIRTSKFRGITDPVLFDICQNLLDNLTANNDLNTFILVRNDVTHIVYGPGGFFKEHRDYLSLRSNIIEEYTLLVCVTPEEIAAVSIGGETRIYVNPFYTHTSKATIKPGNALLFRKDLVHEGLVVELGGKEIVSMNIWVTRKQTKNDGVLFVTFPQIESKVNNPILEAVYGQSYALSLKQVRKFPKTALAANCHFKSNTDNIYYYKCTDVTYEQFGIVFRAMCGMYLSPDEAKENMDVLDYFGLSPENLLIDIIGAEKYLSSAPPMLDNYQEEDIDIDLFHPSFSLGLGGECCKTCNKSNFLTNLFACSKCKQVRYCSRKCQIMHWNESHKAECGKNNLIVKNTDFIICPSDERTTVISKLAVGFKQPYIRFRIIFAEGAASFGGEMSGTDPVIFKMNPVWASFGDYDNILFQSSLMTTSVSIDNPVSISELIIDDPNGLYNNALSIGNQLVHFVDEYDNEESEEEIQKDIAKLQVNDKINPKTSIRVVCDNYNGNIKFDLQIAKAESTNFSDLTNLILGQESEHTQIIPFNGVVLPNNGKTLYQYKYFHIDETNKTCFTAQEATDMCKYLDDTCFIDRVKNQINNVDFELPQLMQTNSGDFCNESVYGTFNFILVSGVMRFDK